MLNASGRKRPIESKASLGLSHESDVKSIVNSDSDAFTRPKLIDADFGKPSALVGLDCAIWRGDSDFLTGFLASQYSTLW